MLIYLDTETTGLNDNDRLCQVAYKTKQETVCEYFKPPLPISIDAMAVNHITNKMVANKPPFIGSPTYQKLKKLFDSPENIVVAHGADYDINMLKREGLNPTRHICTRKLIHAVGDRYEMEKHNLQFLRYYFDIEFENEIIAHDALGDIIVLEQVFINIYEHFYKTKDKTKNQMIIEFEKISNLPVLLTKIPFGKYEGKSFTYIADNDIGYLQWLNRQSDLSEEIQHALDQHL